MKEPTWGVKAAYGRVTPHTPLATWAQFYILFLVKAPTMNECEEARGLRSFAFQKDSNYSKNLLERSV